MDNTRTRFGPTDGVLGIKAEVIRSNNWNEIKLFASQFMASYAEAMQERRSSGPYGETVVNASPENAALGGSARVLNEYAARVQKAIEANGEYARIRAGKQFLLYVTQTILPADADIPAPVKIRANKEAEAGEVKHDKNMRELRKESDMLDDAMKRMKAMQSQMGAGLPSTK
jgi:hypothetical protein